MGKVDREIIAVDNSAPSKSATESAKVWTTEPRKSNLPVRTLLVGGLVIAGIVTASILYRSRKPALHPQDEPVLSGIKWTFGDVLAGQNYFSEYFEVSKRSAMNAVDVHHFLDGTRPREQAQDLRTKAQTELRYLQVLTPPVMLEDFHAKAVAAAKALLSALEGSISASEAKETRKAFNAAFKTQEVQLCLDCHFALISDKYETRVNDAGHLVLSPEAYAKLRHYLAALYIYKLSDGRTLKAATEEQRVLSMDPLWKASSLIVEVTYLSPDRKELKGQWLAHVDSQTLEALNIDAKFLETKAQ
jgi:hypothetical protein